MKNFDYEIEEFKKFEKECKDKIYEKFFKNEENVEESILLAFKKQILNLTHIYIYIAELLNLLESQQKTNPNKTINFYQKHILNIYAGIDIAMANFCTMTEQMSENS